MINDYFIILQIAWEETQHLDREQTWFHYEIYELEQRVVRIHHLQEILQLADQD